MSCFCRGPQNGEPLCPCEMVGVTIKNGRYVRPARDLGPVAKVPPSTLRERIERAQKEVATWSKRKRDSVQLQGMPGGWTE